MLAGTILAITDKKDSKEAWDAIFRHFNKQKGKVIQGMGTPKLFLSR